VPRSIIICAGVHDRDKVAGRHRPPRRAVGEAVSRVLRGVAASRCGRPNVTPAVVAGHAAAAERGENRATQAANPGARGRVPGQGEEEEEETPGEEERAEGGQNTVGHTANVHHHVDAVQHTGAAETVHGGHGGRQRRRKRGRQQQGMGDAGHVGLFLLPVLHQQHHQPGVLRPVQRHVPHDLRADTQVQVEHPQAATALPRVMMTAATTGQRRGGYRRPAYSNMFILQYYYIHFRFRVFFLATRLLPPIFRRRHTAARRARRAIVRLSTLFAPLTHLYVLLNTARTEHNMHQLNITANTGKAKVRLRYGFAIYYTVAISTFLKTTDAQHNKILIFQQHEIQYFKSPTITTNGK